MTATTKLVQHKHANRRVRKPVTKRQRTGKATLADQATALGRTLVRVDGDRARQVGGKKPTARKPLKNEPASILARMVFAIAVRQRRSDAAKRVVS